MISVGGAGINNNITWFSTYNDRISVVAPSAHITVLGVDGSYRKASGTSFAAPYVSAQMAILKSLYPNKKSIEFIKVIEETALDGGLIGKDNYYGHGVATLDLSISKLKDVLSGDYRLWDSSIIAKDSKKQFTISYNGEIEDAGSITVIDEFYNEYPITTDVKGNEVIVSPKHQWDTNQIYTICIKDTMSKDQRMLSKEIRMKFRIQGDQDQERRMISEGNEDFVDMIEIEN